MLDFVSWYLVELDLRLRGKRTCLATADFLRETRSHLEERVDDLMALGMDRQAASKAAIADFGDPTTVANSYARSKSLSKWIVWGGLAFAAWCLWTVSTALITIPNDVIGLSGRYSQFSFAPMPTLALGIALLLVLKTRKWLTVPLCIFALVGVTGTTYYFAANTAVRRVGDRDRLVYAPSLGPQIGARAAWLLRFDRDMAKVQAWRTARALKQPNADLLLDGLAKSGGGVMAPLPQLTNYYFGVPDLLQEANRAGEGQPFYLLHSGPRKMYSISHYFQNIKSARESWKLYGDKYVAYAKDMRRQVEGELAALTNPLRTSVAERWRMTAYPAYILTLVGCVIALMSNGILIGLLDLVDSRRRRAWRQRVT